MGTICKYCNEPEDKQLRPGLVCDSCAWFVHLTCLKRLGTPGDLACDVFFDFTCEECSPGNKEVFTRKRIPWVNVILLTLHHLTTNAYGISNHGFFHYKTHICCFIDRNWAILFDPQFKQKKNWVGTIAGALSVYSNLMFRSGSAVLGETGWWRLQHAFSPAVASHIILEMAREKPKGRPRNQMAMDITLFVAKATEMGYKEYLLTEADSPPVAAERPVKKRRLELDYSDPQDSDSRGQETQEEESAQTQDGFSEGETYRFPYQPASYIPPSDSSTVHSLQQAAPYYDSDSRSASPHFQPEPESLASLAPPALENDKPEPKKKPKEKRVLRRESLFSAELNSCVELPWVDNYEVQSDLVDLTQYQEVQLLKQVETLAPAVRDPNRRAHLHRLRAKLALRRLKRHKHLPIFDLDKAVKVLSGQMPEDSRSEGNGERVLDRFQRSYVLDNLCGTIPDTTYGITLLADVEPVPFRSAFSCALLPPYIRRQRAARAPPAWLRLQHELLARTHRHVPGYRAPAHAHIDYSYVRPHHIAAVNNLCAQFFWPGIDLTEALEYPEFSCVATYRRLVVGCAFLVPRARAAYISFVLVRPGWRRAGVAAFMLYHLLQTCSGTDVTLHVSPTNPAIFLYQKFGFKVEELVQDFYEKYFDIDYKGCRHALFLRLTR